MEPAPAEDKTAEIIGHLNGQMAMLIGAIPGLLALHPNTEQLVAMGKAMYQGAMQIPGASPVQASYLQSIRALADKIVRK
jgi:hypothetical protein